VSVLWTEASDDDEREDGEIEAHCNIDETLASRRLQRWLRGMFGGGREQAPPPPEHEPEN
jgi:hypothetical protein